MGSHSIKVMDQNIFRSTHIAVQHLFLCFLQFLLLMLSNVRPFFLAFLGPNVLFWGLGSGSEIVLGSTHTVKQLLFSIFPSILTFDFDLILRSFWLFGPLMGYIWGQYRAQTTFNFYDSFNSGFGIWLNLRVIFDFLGP